MLFDYRYPLNYNYHEIKKLSNNSADVIMLSYLHFNMAEKITSMRSFIRQHCLTDYPTLDWTFYSYKEYKTNSRYSAFSVTPNSRLNYIRILEEDMYEEDKLKYLELTSLVTPYYKNKFVPEIFVSRVPNELVLRGLVNFVDGGIVLPKER